MTFTSRRGPHKNETIVLLISRLIWARLGYKIFLAIFTRLKKRYYDPRMGITPAPEVFYEIKERWLIRRMKQLGIEQKHIPQEKKSADKKVKAE